MKSLVIGDDLAEKLARLLNLEAILIEERIFSDGELQPRLQKEEKVDQIILILQKRTNENINDYLLKYFLLARKAKDLAKKVIGIMPYLPYARQDAVFQGGESLSALYVDELIEKNLDVFITCNMHEHRKRIKDLFKIPAYNLFLFKDLAEKFQDFKTNNSVVIGPDREAKTFVDDFCINFSAQKLVFLKQRDAKTGKITFSHPEKDLQGKEVIIIDDIVATGGTILEAAKIAHQLKAKTISFAFVHPIFGDQSIASLRKINPKRIITTNTLENSKYELDITEPLARFLKKEINLTSQ
jgi:ribose-phosphate pyrophosphokinase